MARDDWVVGLWACRRCGQAIPAELFRHNPDGTLVHDGCMERRCAVLARGDCSASVDGYCVGGTADGYCHG